MDAIGSAFFDLNEIYNVSNPNIEICTISGAVSTSTLLTNRYTEVARRKTTGKIYGVSVITSGGEASHTIDTNWKLTGITNPNFGGFATVTSYSASTPLATFTVAISDADVYVTAIRLDTTYVITACFMFMLMVFH